MKKKHTVWLLLSLFVVLIVGSSSSIDNKAKGKNNAMSQEVFIPEKHGYKLVWQDDFDGTSLDTTKWRYRLTGPRRIGFNDSTQVKVENGNLLLMYDIKGNNVLGSMVGTGETYRTKYGYFECRARLQKGIGPWSAFWFQSPGIFKGEDPAKYGAEIDIFEYFKELGDNVLTHNTYWAYGPHQQTGGQMVSEIDGLSEGFHTFALEWTKDKYAFYIDGLKFHEQRKGVSQVEEYMILSMEIPERLECLKNACAPDTFIVDYVKVYKKK